MSNFSNQKTEFEKFANFSNYFLSNRTNFELKIIEFFELFLPFRINRIVNFRIESNEFRTNPNLTPPLIWGLTWAFERARTRDEFGPGPGPAWPGPGLSKAIFGVWPTMGLGRIILSQARPSLWIWKLERPIGPNCGPWAKFF